MLGTVKKLLAILGLLLVLGQAGEATASILVPVDCGDCASEPADRDCTPVGEDPAGEAGDPFCAFCACCVHATTFAPSESFSVFVPHFLRSFVCDSMTRAESPDPNEVIHVPKILLS
jgi:hypothetical protein